MLTSVMRALVKEVKIEIFHKKQQLFDVHKIEDSTFHHFPMQSFYIKFFLTSVLGAPINISLT